MSSALFDYDAKKVYAQSIEVDDIGNCALRCSNQKFEDYYICTQTVDGKTFILKFGPIVADLDVIDELFELSYKKINYKESKIEREIKLLLQDGKKSIDQVELIKVEDALNMIPTYDKFIPE